MISTMTCCLLQNNCSPRAFGKIEWSRSRRAQDVIQLPQEDPRMPSRFRKEVISALTNTGTRTESDNGKPTRRARGDAHWESGLTGVEGRDWKEPFRKTSADHQPPGGGLASDCSCLHWSQPGAQQPQHPWRIQSGAVVMRKRRGTSHLTVGRSRQLSSPRVYWVRT